uniref:Ovule protein n=1 Tax=Mesocestoides corti TaxID=53468 RepID=A0A5K3EYB6_MESCO
EQALLTNHKPEPHVRRLPSASTTSPQLCPSLVGCSSFSHAIGTQTRDWLSQGGPTHLRPNPTPHYTASPSEAIVEYPSPNTKKTGTTEQALLTNQKPEPHVRRLPSESVALATPLIIYCSSVVSLSG